MAIDVGGLVNWVKEDTREPIIKYLYKEASVISRVANKLPGIKSSTKIPLLDDTIWLADGSTGCATISPSGDTVLTQFSLTPGKIKVEKSWCVDDLEPKFTSAWLKEGSNYNESDLPRFLSDITLKKLVDKFNSRDWFATTAADRYTGLGTNMELAGGFAYNVTATALVTSSNAISIVDEFYANIPARLAQATDKTLFVGYEVYRLIITAYKNINYFTNMDFNAAAKSLECMAPGTDFTIKADMGLNRAENGKDRMYLMPESNIWMAFDGTGDDSTLDIFQDKLTEKIYARMKCKRTFQVARTADVMRYSNF